MLKSRVKYLQQRKTIEKKTKRNAIVCKPRESFFKTWSTFCAVTDVPDATPLNFTVCLNITFA